MILFLISLNFLLDPAVFPAVISSYTQAVKIFTSSSQVKSLGTDKNLFCNFSSFGIMEKQNMLSQFIYN